MSDEKQQDRTAREQELMDALYKVWKYAGDIEAEVARCEPAHLSLSAEQVFNDLLKMLPRVGREFIDRERAERDALRGQR